MNHLLDESGSRLPQPGTRDIHCSHIVGVFDGIDNGTVCRPHSGLAAARVVCELYEDPREIREYQRWQGYLEARWEGGDGPCFMLTLGAYILVLEDGSKGLIHTTRWRGGYFGPRTTQFVSPGPTAFESG